MKILLSASVGLFIYVENQWLLAIAAHGLARIAYIYFIFSFLGNRSVLNSWICKLGPLCAFDHFRERVQLAMYLDAFTFVALCGVTADSLGFASGRTVAAGLAMILFGGFIKLWSAALLEDGYYWKNFFLPMPFVKTGPYRLFSNPMYTLGYLPMYGFAFALASGPGLFASFIDQILILFFYYRIEKPRQWRMYASSGL